MIGVVLVAGVSRRLYPLTEHRPKCLPEVGSKTIFDHQMNALRACGVREVLPSAPVVPPWDAAKLAATIVDLLSDEARRQDLVARGRAELDALTWASSARQLEAALEEARSTSRRRTPA